MSQYKIIIVDDHPVFRQGMRTVLETDPQIQVVGEAANGEVAIQQAEELGPDVIIMDINLPDIKGLQVTRQIRDRRPEIKVVIITGFDDAEQAFHAIRAGASAYIAKDIAPELLISTILAVQEGHYVVDEHKMTHDEVVMWVEEKVGRITDSITTDTEDSFVPLSPREMEILEHVTYGKGNKEIAHALGISDSTVKNHMTAILKKLSLDDRTQAAVYAYSRGWLKLDRPLRD